MTAAEVTAYVKRELDEDAAREQQYATSAGVVPTETSTGTTLDLSHKNIHALPVEVIGLIKDRVERSVHVLEEARCWTDNGQVGALAQPADCRAETDRAV